MAKSKVSQGTRTSKEPAEVPVSDEIRRAAARAALTESAPPVDPDPEVDDTEREETMAERGRRLDLERHLLACTVPGSLGARLRQLLGQGTWIDSSAPDPGNSNTMSGSLDFAISRAASVQIRALALALNHGFGCESMLSDELALSNEDASFALASIAMMLDVGMEIADNIRAAQCKRMSS